MAYWELYLRENLVQDDDEEILELRKRVLVLRTFLAQGAILNIIFRGNYEIVLVVGDGRGPVFMSGGR